ncbi:SURF6-domain-containing protein [Atractiella rhizophila]|nr:SURF6-domain-containing protein [Atractiella rhizophila]
MEVTNSPKAKKGAKPMVQGKRKRESNLAMDEAIKKAKIEATQIEPEDEGSSDSSETPVPPSAIPSRLHERLAEIKAAREARSSRKRRNSASPILSLSLSPPVASSTSSPVPEGEFQEGPKSREEMLAERKRRGEMRDRRRKATKLRKKQEKWETRQEEKRSRKEEKDKKTAEEKTKGKQKLEEKDLTSKTPEAPQSDAPIASTSSRKIDVDVDAANFRFSNLDFTPASTTDVATSIASFKKPQKNSTETALAAIEKRRKFLDKLNPACLERAEEKDRWESATKRAEGVKVADKEDEEKLKKALKRKEKQKDKSRKDWKERQVQAADKMKERQQKRADNIAARAQAKKDKRMGVKGKKAGKARPGFEGGRVRKSGVMGKRK